MISDPVVRGLARNPAAPLDVLLGLLQAAPSPACQGLRDRRDVPRPVQDTMLHHPSTKVRGTLAQHPQADPEIRARLLADPEWRVAVRAFGSPGQQPVSDEALNSLLTRIEDPGPESLFTSVELLGELSMAMGYGQRLYRLAAAHPDPRVRRRAAAVPQWLDDPTRAALTADPVPEIRATIGAATAEERRVMQLADLPDHHCHGYWAVLQRPLSRALVDHVVAGDEAALYFVGPNPSTPPDVVQELLRHPAVEVRSRLAERADLSPEQLRELAADPSVEVRTAVSVYPGLTERQRAGIEIDVSTVRGDGHYGSRRQCRGDDHAFVDERVPPRADALRWARSVNPLLRRRAARDPGLPADLVTALADDTDLGVRVLLARHHPDAPPALLRRCFPGVPRLWPGATRRASPVPDRGPGRVRRSHRPGRTAAGSPGPACRTRTRRPAVHRSGHRRTAGHGSLPAPADDPDHRPPRRPGPGGTRGRQPGPTGRPDASDPAERLRLTHGIRGDEAVGVGAAGPIRRTGLAGRGR